MSLPPMSSGFLAAGSDCIEKAISMSARVLAFLVVALSIVIVMPEMHPENINDGRSLAIPDKD